MTKLPSVIKKYIIRYWELYGKRDIWEAQSPCNLVRQSAKVIHGFNAILIVNSQPNLISFISKLASHSFSGLFCPNALLSQVSNWFPPLIPLSMAFWVEVYYSFGKLLSNTPNITIELDHTPMLLSNTLYYFGVWLNKTKDGWGYFPSLENAITQY